MGPQMRNSHIIIHVDHFIGNIAAIREFVGPGIKLSVAVKADAYGHGAVELARAAVAAGVEYLGVASPQEALTLRRSGIASPIILYGLCLPESRRQLIECDVASVAADADTIEDFGRVAADAGRRGRLHLKVDTGMGRIGCPVEEAPELALMIARHPNLELEGLMTHFPSADLPDDDFTKTQIEQFERCLQIILQKGVQPQLVHAANSAGILNYPAAGWNMVRPGILTYGYYPSFDTPRTLVVRPVMELRAPLVFIKKLKAGSSVSYGRTWSSDRDTWIGTLAAGYADGYPRRLSGLSRVLLAGRSYPVVGRVCMDQLMIDLGPKAEVELFEQAVLFGPDPAGPDAWEIAGLAGTIPYEITCGAGRFSRREYRNGRISPPKF